MENGCAQRIAWSSTSRNLQKKKSTKAAVVVIREIKIKKRYGRTSSSKPKRYSWINSTHYPNKFGSIAEQIQLTSFLKIKKGEKMKCNLGKLDRIFRFASGWILVLLLVFVVKDNLLQWILGILAGISLFESFFGWCGLHNIFNVNLKNQ